MLEKTKQRYLQSLSQDLAFWDRRLLECATELNDFRCDESKALIATVETLIIEYEDIEEQREIVRAKINNHETVLRRMMREIEG